MKKKLTVAAFCLAICILQAFSAFAAEGEVYTQKSLLKNYVTVVVDGNEVKAPNLVIDGKTYLGIRTLAGVLGYDVKWNGEDKLVVLESGAEKNFGTDEIAKGNDYETVSILEDYVNAVVINGEPKKVSNVVYNDATYLGLRDVGNILGYEVSWDEQTRTAKLSKDKAETSLNVQILDENGEKNQLATIYYKIYRKSYPDATDEEVLEAVSDQLELMAFVESVVKDNNISYEKPDVENGYPEYISAYGSMDVYNATLESFSITPEEDYIYDTASVNFEAMRESAADFLIANLDSVNELKQQAKEKYNQEKNSLAKEVSTVKHILIQPKSASAEDVAAAETTANEIYEKARNTRDFDLLVSLYNTDLGQPEEGYAVTGDGTFVPEFEEAAMSLVTGEISPVVKTKFGFHIIKCLSKGNKTPSFDEYFLKNYENEYAKLLDDEYFAFKDKNPVKLKISK